MSSDPNITVKRGRGRPRIGTRRSIYIENDVWEAAAELDMQQRPDAGRVAPSVPIRIWLVDGWRMAGNIKPAVCGDINAGKVRNIVIPDEMWDRAVDKANKYNMRNGGRALPSQFIRAWILNSYRYHRNGSVK